MSVPELVGYRIETTDTGGVKTYDLPTNAKEGDTVAFIATSSWYRPSLYNTTGWTQFIAEDDGDYTYATGWYKKIEAGEASPRITISSTDQAITGVIVAVRGDVDVVGSDNGGSTSVSIPAATCTKKGLTLLLVGCAGTSGSADCKPSCPSGWTELASGDYQGDSNDSSGYLAATKENSAGSTGSVSVGGTSGDLIAGALIHFYAEPTADPLFLGGSI